MTDQKRTYRMKRRAELEEQTRLRITESAIADRAGVRRSTVYRHFPDDDAIFTACSSHWRAANPPPDPVAWAAIDDPAARTETALRELYAFYSRTQRMYTSLLRDEPHVPAVQRRLRDFHGYLEAVQGVLMADRGLRGAARRRTQAAIGHAVAFATWQSLTSGQPAAADDAGALMCVLVEGAADAR